MIGRLSGLDLRETTWHKLNTDNQLLKRTGSYQKEKNETSRGMPEHWTVRLLPIAPNMQALDARRVPSIYHTTAEEITENPTLSSATYAFQSTTTSREVGLQVLSTIGWRPDCARAQKMNVQRLPPPPTRRHARLFFGPPDANDGIAAEEIYDFADNPPTDTHTYRVEVTTRKNKTVPMTLAYIRYPNGTAGLENKFWGVRKNIGYNDFAKEIAAGHALDLVIQINSLQPIQNKTTQHHFVVEAGTPLACTRLGTWFSAGRWHLKSSAGERIASKLYELAGTLECPLTLYGYYYDQHGAEDIPFTEDLDTGWTEIEISYIRACRLIDEDFFRSLAPRLPYVPQTVDEFKNDIKIRYEIDELRALKSLRGEGS